MAKVTLYTHHIGWAESGESSDCEVILFEKRDSAPVPPTAIEVESELVEALAVNKYGLPHDYRWIIPKGVALAELQAPKSQWVSANLMGCWKCQTHFVFVNEQRLCQKCYDAAPTSMGRKVIEDDSVPQNTMRTEPRFDAGSFLEYLNKHPLLSQKKIVFDIEICPVGHKIDDSGQSIKESLFKAAEMIADSQAEWQPRQIEPVLPEVYKRLQEHGFIEGDWSQMSSWDRAISESPADFFNRKMGGKDNSRKRVKFTRHFTSEADYTGADIFGKVCERLEVSGEFTLDYCEAWGISLPEDIVDGLTPDTAPELERRLTLALRILKEGK